MRFSGGVGHSGSEMLDANSRGQLYTFIVGAIRYNTTGYRPLYVQVTVYLESSNAIVVLSLMHTQYIQSVILYTTKERTNEHISVSTLISGERVREIYFVTTFITRAELSINFKRLARDETLSTSLLFQRTVQSFHPWMATISWQKLLLLPLRYVIPAKASFLRAHARDQEN